MLVAVYSYDSCRLRPNYCSEFSFDYDGVFAKYEIVKAALSHERFKPELFAYPQNVLIEYRPTGTVVKVEL